MLTLLLLAVFAWEPPGKYVVLVDPGPDGAFRPAAEALARFHRGDVLNFSSQGLPAAMALLTARQPDFVAFVLPPDQIDVDLVHQIMEMSTQLDDDPFVDFEFGFITGRDGPAALRFVERIVAAWQTKPGRSAGLFGSWEGPTLPPRSRLTAFQALGMDADSRYVPMQGPPADRAVRARAALADLAKKDALLFFSHGYPDEMVGCFKAKELRDWQVELKPALLVSCACYNGAPGRWFAPGADGSPRVQPAPAPADSICLQLLESGPPALIAGIDPWHGPLAIQVFGYVVDDGLRLGAATKRMYDRLALDFAPQRLHFPPTLEVKNRFAGEGVLNRRHNGAGMILFGDPAWAPFAHNASKLQSAQITAATPLALRLRWQPQVIGQPADDFLVPMNRLLDYYSVKTADVLKELSLEVYQVVPLPEGVPAPAALFVTSARSGDADVATKPVQLLLERHAGQRLLHIRVPLAVRAIGTPWTVAIARKGLTVDLVATPPQEREAK